MRATTCQPKLIGLGVAVSALLLAAGAAEARPGNVRDFQPISGPSPLTQPCELALETEPQIAVNPRNEQHVVASWLEGAAQAIVVAVSRDGGRTWTQVLPGPSGCTGVIRGDPRLAFDASGRVLYLASGCSASCGESPAGADLITVIRSDDGGFTWNALAPKVVTGHLPDGCQGACVNAESSITADPTTPGRAYVTWTRRDSVAVGFAPWHGYFSRTDDGGEHWSEPRIMYTPGENAFPLSHDLRVLPDGSLLDVFVEYADDQAHQVALRLAPDGTILSGPVTIAAVPDIKASDPDTCRRASSCINTQGAVKPGFDVARSGTAYVTWQEIRAHDAFCIADVCGRQVDSSAIRVARSTNGGRTWVELDPVITERPRLCAGEVYQPQAFQPMLAVSDYLVGVTYYDFRNDCPDGVTESELRTDFWFARLDNHGWDETHVAGPFDLRSSFDPTTGAYLLGEVDGLAAARGGFVAAFVLGRPAATEPPTDVFFAHIGVARANRVKNGSFEQANTAGTGPAGWSAQDTAAGTTSWSDGGIDGSKAATISGTGGSAPVAGTPTWTSDPVAVTPGETLELVVSVEAAALSSAASAGLDYLGSEGQPLDTVKLIVEPLVTAGFEELTQTVTIPAGVAEVRVVLSGFATTDFATAGTVSFDHVGLFAH